MPAITTNTKLALNFQGKTTGTKEIRDYGNTGHIATQVATAQLSTAQKKFGSTSLLLDGNSDYLTVPDHADWNFGTGDFTIDCWYYQTDWNTTIIGQFANENNQWLLDFSEGPSGGQRIRAYWIVGGVVKAHYTTIKYDGAPLTFNTWHHLALVRNGANGYIFVDGVPLTIDTSTPFGTTDLTDFTGDLIIGKGLASTLYWNGYINELRISKGIARWTADFSATLPTAPYGCDANTQLLLHCNSYDVCPTPKIPTFAGTAQVSTAQKEFGESSLLLDGNSDYLTVPDSADWDLGTNPFTIDFWVYFNTVQNSFFVAQDANAGGMSMNGVYWSANKLYFSSSGPSSDVLQFYGAWTPSTGQWYHVAVVRVNTDNADTAWRIFIDGVPGTLTKTTGAWNGTMADLTAPLYIGYGIGYGWYMGSGYIDGLRIVNGTALWTADFSASLPTSPPYVQYYSRKAGAAPADDADLTTKFTTEEDWDLKLEDGIRISQTASATNSAIFQFKDVIPGKNVAVLTWHGQTDVAGSDSTIYLQAYNRTTTTWVTITSNNTVAANTDFTLTGTISGLTNYLDADGLISCRVYQTAI